MKLWAVILAGGLGTRLRNITRDRWPKPMTPFACAGRKAPFLEFQLAWLQRCGITRVLLCIGHLGGQIQEYFGDGRRLGLDIRYDDAGAAQTATRLQRAFRLFDDERCLVLCGDVWCPLDATGFVDAAERHPDWLIQVAVQPGAAEPNIAWGADHRALAYGALPAGAPHSGREAGVLLVRRVALADHDTKSDLSLTADIYPRLVGQRSLGIFEIKCSFIDIGSSAGHEQFRLLVARGGIEPLHPPPQS